MKRRAGEGGLYCTIAQRNSERNGTQIDLRRDFAPDKHPKDATRYSVVEPAAVGEGEGEGEEGGGSIVGEEASVAGISEGDPVEAGILEEQVGDHPQPGPVWQTPAWAVAEVFVWSEEGDHRDYGKRRILEGGCQVSLVQNTVGRRPREH